jgi:hypothetical protein
MTKDLDRLLDESDFREDPDGYPAVGADIAGQLRRLAISGFTGEEVAAGLKISASRVRQKRLARELWAVADGQSWLFPISQFERGANGGPMRQIRGLDQVFKALAPDLHPVAIDGFLYTPQGSLFVDKLVSPLEWLIGGGDIAQAVTAATVAEWYSR